MKKVFTPIFFLISLGIISFVIFTNAKVNILSDDDALVLGEEKYLKFLWMVDGAFNSERMNGDFLVNNKKISDDDKTFTCDYKNKKSNECVGNNFEKEFKELFANSIDYKRVYGDGHIFTWYTYDNGKYIFSQLDNCSVNRMGLKHQIKVLSKSIDKISYQVVFDNENVKIIKKEFILIKEDNEWKISKAYYYDMCEMEYNIE